MSMFKPAMAHQTRFAACPALKMEVIKEFTSKTSVEEVDYQRLGVLLTKVGRAHSSLSNGEVPTPTAEWQNAIDLIRVQKV